MIVCLSISLSICLSFCLYLYLFNPAASNAVLITARLVSGPSINSDQDRVATALYVQIPPYVHREVSVTRTCTAFIPEIRSARPVKNVHCFRQWERRQTAAVARRAIRAPLPAYLQ